MRAEVYCGKYTKIQTRDRLSITWKRSNHSKPCFFNYIYISVTSVSSNNL